MSTRYEHRRLEDRQREQLLKARANGDLAAIAIVEGRLDAPCRYPGCRRGCASHESR